MSRPRGECAAAGRTADTREHQLRMNVLQRNLLLDGGRPGTRTDPAPSRKVERFYAGPYSAAERRTGDFAGFEDSISEGSGR